MYESCQNKSRRNYFIEVLQKIELVTYYCQKQKMNEMHIKVFKLTKENVKKKYDSSDQQLDVIPQFRQFMKQREPYNNYLQNHEINQKPNINYPALQTSNNRSNHFNTQRNKSPLRITEPNPLTNQFLKQQDNITNSPKKFKSDPQQTLSSLLPANFEKQTDQKWQSQQGQRSLITIHSRSLNSRNLNSNNQNSLRKQGSPKINHNKHFNTLQQQELQNPIQMKQMLYVLSHPQLQQTEMLQINNCFKPESIQYQNTLNQDQTIIKKQNKSQSHHEGQDNNSFQEIDQSLTNKIRPLNQKIINNYVIQNKISETDQNVNESKLQFENHDQLDNSRLQQTYSSPFKISNQINYDDFKQENSTQEFMATRNLFIGNNICNKGRPSSSKYFFEQRNHHSPKSNTNIQLTQLNKFIVKGFQVKKS